MRFVGLARYGDDGDREIDGGFVNLAAFALGISTYWYEYGYPAAITMSLLSAEYISLDAFSE
jgi:hypothetical protein